MTLTETQPNRHTDHGLTTARLVLAFATVYVAWGGTYIAIRFAIETLPALCMAGSRFFLAGVILMAALRLFHSPGFHWGTVREWRDATVVGLLLIFIGNGCLTWSEQYVPSGVASLFFAITPLWMVLFDWLHPGGKRPSLNTALGLCLGFAGIWILRDSSASLPNAHELNLGYLVLLVTGCSWGAGAIYARHVHAQGSPLLPIARQMIIGGLALVIAGAVRGEWHAFSLEQVTLRSWLGYAYLLIFGSLLGFTAYVWLMKVSTPARVGTTAYINPIIAVALGWSIGHEPLTWRVGASAAIIVASVIVVLRKPR